MKNQFIGMHLDFIGFSASLLCAIHCAVLPFLLGIASYAGLHVIDNPMIEYGFIFLSLIVASKTLIHGWRKHHKKLLALITAITGFIIIAIGQFSQTEWQEIILTPSGGVLIAIAHVINWRGIKKSKT